MLYALRQPATFLGLLLGYVVAMVALTAVLRRFERGSRGARPWWHPRTWADPYSAVAAALAGTGWAPRPEVRRVFGSSEQRRLWLVALISVVVPGVLAAAAIGGYVASVGTADGLPFFSTTAVLHGNDLYLTESTLDRILLGFGAQNLAVAVLSLIPIPPLATGVAAWSTLPRTPGSRRFAARLLEENWGIFAVLLLLVVPLAGEYPLLLQLIGKIGDSIVRAF